MCFASEELKSEIEQAQRENFPVGQKMCSGQVLGGNFLAGQGLQCEEMPGQPFSAKQQTDFGRVLQEPGIGLGMPSRVRDLQTCLDYRGLECRVC